jgi:hypothetical protein
MDNPSRRRLRGPAAGVLTVGAVSLVVPALLSGPASAASPTASSVISASKAAIGQQSSVHVVFAAKQGSSPQEKIVADAGKTSGKENITDGSGHVAIRVTPTDAYVSGNASGLSSILGLTASEAEKVGSRWIYWKSGTSQYSTLKADVTMSSVSGLLPKAKGTNLSTTTVGGRQLYVLKWTEAATSSAPKLSNTLQLAATGPTLPVVAVSTASGGDRASTTLSGWGDPVVVTAPPSSSTVSAPKITG